ncbi:MAG: TniB family NTP-binding protein [Betaproteobacteria bacterium]|nr:TniB family NTP-binding protein [Betaproteobacteria bacterium]
MDFQPNQQHDAGLTQLDVLCRLGLPEDSPAPHPHSAFTLRNRVIEHPEFADAVRRLANAHLRFKRNGQAQGLAFVGQSGSGKSTVLDYYADKFPFQQHATGRYMSVIRVLTPESPTVKSLAQAFLDAMDVPGADKGTGPEKTKRIIKYLCDCRVEVIAVDEFHHFFELGRSTRDARAIADWLKNLLSRCKVVMVLVGLPKSILALNGSQQLRRRFASAHYMKPFGYVTAEEQEVFQAVLEHLQSLLPCPCIDLGEPETARQFFFASQGLIDYLIKILEGAVCRGGSGPKGKILLGDFAEAFREEVWSSCPDSLNPFVPGAILRPLTQPKEPFEGWDDIEQYVLSREAKALAGKAKTKAKAKAKQGGSRHE